MPIAMNTMVCLFIHIIWKWPMVINSWIIIYKKFNWWTNNHITILCVKPQVFFSYNFHRNGYFKYIQLWYMLTLYSGLMEDSGNSHANALKLPQFCVKPSIWSKIIQWLFSPKFCTYTVNTWDISTHWGRVTHICVNKPTVIGSDNGLSPGQCQAIMWTNDGILLIGPMGTNFSAVKS